MAPDTAARCTGDDSCQVPDHWPDPASSGPHRGTATAAPVWPRWSVRRWLVTIGVAVGIALSIVVFSNAPWWTGLILGVCLPAALFGTEAQRNLEWVGYHRCPTCSGSGKVRDV